MQAYVILKWNNPSIIYSQKVNSILLCYTFLYFVIPEPAKTSTLSALHLSGFNRQKNGGTTEEVIKEMEFVLMTAWTLGSFASP